MFYDNNPENKLRFGDVVRGFLLTHCHSYDPSFAEKLDAYQIDVAHPKLAVVLTPCCTIAQHGGNMLVLSPLREIRPDIYFNNSFLREDLTRINREMTIQHGIGPEKWEKMSDEERSQHLSKAHGEKYIMLDLFVYDKHDLLPEYRITYKGQKANTNYYMIDFRNITRVQTPPDINPTTVKILQLSVQARAELRDKLAHYFGRKPEEDEI